jgi:hypothetical protein
MVLTVSFVLAPETGLCCLRRRREAQLHRQVDISVGMSGPHDFTVRKWRIRQRAIGVHRIPSHVRDDRETPLPLLLLLLPSRQG